eukprot:symbB.v1.2.032947.t1/scaffold4030.1/size45894/2
MKNMEAALRKGEAKELQMDSPPRQKESGQPASEVVPSTISPASTVSVPQGCFIASGRGDMLRMHVARTAPPQCLLPQQCRWLAPNLL